MIRARCGHGSGFDSRRIHAAGPWLVPRRYPPGVRLPSRPRLSTFGGQST